MGCHCLLRRHVIHTAYTYMHIYMGFPGDSVVKESACQCKRCKRWEFDPWVRKIPWRKTWQSTPVFLPGEAQGWQSLVGSCLWGRTESDTTERVHFHFSLSCIGEGNGNPLQCPCLENPRDGEAWWAAVSGVTQSQT